MHYVTRAGEEVFRWVLQTTWQAAALAGLILVAQWILRKRLSAAWRHGLWLLLVARLMMPATPQSALSVFNLFQSKPEPPLASRLYANTQSNPYNDVNVFNGTPSSNVHAGPIETLPLPAPSSVIVKPTLKVDWFDVALCGWLAGVCFFGARLVWANARFRSRISGCQPVADESVMRVFNECRAALNITQAVRVIESEEVETPAVYGLWRKWLLLPDGVFERFGEGDLRCIFLHELAHIKRGDLGVNWLVSVLQVAHWFNPALRFAFARMRADREMAADALALAHVGKAENVAYGETILKIVENLARDAAQPGLVGIAESKAGLAQRVRAIAQFSATRHWKWAAVVAAIVVAGVGLTDARQETVKVSEPPAVSTDKSKPLREITGVIVDPDGRPANGAQVALMIRKTRPQMTGESVTLSDLGLSGKPRLFNPKFGHPMGKTRSVPWNFCTTDKDGRFYLDDLEGATLLLAACEKGFCEIPTDQFSAKMTVKLESWGQIDGTVRRYDEPFTNESVSVGLADNHDYDWGRNTKFETNTDDRGRFFFDYVPPGKFTVLTAGISKKFTVEPGQTAAVKIGGEGRTVVGRFKVSDPKVKFLWDIWLESCMLFPEPPRPSQPFKTAAEYIAWMGKPEVRNWISKRDVIAYKVRHEADGSFRIDQVEPGNYLLSVGVVDPMNRYARKVMKQIGGFNRTFEIPANKSNVREPVDLGEVEVSLDPEEQRARVLLPPADFQDSPAPPAQKGKGGSASSSDSNATFRGTVCFADGTPVAGAQVGVRNSWRHLRIGDGKFEVRTANDGIVITAADGSFSTEMYGATALYAISDAGYARVPTTQWTNGVKIVLEPWGHVRGMVRSDNRPGPIGTVSLFADEYDQGPQLASTLIDDQGRFAFDHIPDGDYKLSRDLTNSAGKGFGSAYFFFQVRSGETTNLVWGGNGRPVTGKYVGNLQDIPRGGRITLRLDSPPELPPFAAGDSTALAEEQRRLVAWWKSDAGRKATQRHRIFSCNVAADGSFEIDDVPTGTYELASYYWPPITNAEDFMEAIGNIRAAPKQIVVPPPTDSSAPEPFDLGDVKINFVKTDHNPLSPVLHRSAEHFPEEGDSARDIETKTIDGRIVRLSDYRGKYVLLDLHVKLSAAETKEIEALSDAFQNDDRLVILSLAVEKDENFVKMLQAKGARHWIQGDLDWDSTIPGYGNPNVGNPNVCLIDPKGKIVALYLSGEAIQSTVAKALAKK